jgi:putative PIG3 family NAD(P)H quinone oxidoreductase
VTLFGTGLMSNTMRAIEIAAPGGPDVLRLVERPMPEAGTGEVLIKVSASGINRPDVLQRLGRYAPPAGASDLPGLEVAGEIVDGDVVAMAASGFRVGDRVCALVSGGGYAQYCAAPVLQCLPIPDGLTDIEAASLPETAFTVWSNVFDRASLVRGETLLIHGGSSGIGVTAIQFAKASGARVLVTVSSASKARACLDLGADHAIDYHAQDFVQEVQRLTDGHGVDVILDMVAGAYVARNVNCLATDGRLVIIGVQGGIHAELDAGAVLRKRLTLTGSTLRPRSVAFKGAIAAALRQTAWPWLTNRQVKPVVHAVFPPHQAANAHALMETNAHIGKIVLDWSLVPQS